MTFYVNSLRHYCASLFLVEPRRNREANLRTVLDRIGDADLLSEVDRILDARLGKVTFAEFLRRYRNKFLVHELFQAGPLLEYFRQQDFDVEIDENWQVFNALEDGLFLETKGILRRLADLYPDL